jgi:EAL domain-containing protein (putative c-di-GMP-specific phosphodiesterase class I)
MEALLRLGYADLPGWTVADAVAAAEESGLIVPVGRWVLGAALRQQAEWTAAGHEIVIAVNVSARHLETGQLVDDVDQALTLHGVDPRSVSLEISEAQLVRDLEVSTRELSRLRERGVRISLDDFGTGFSSLSYLPRLPLDGLKIDRELVARAGAERDTVPAVLRLGRDLGLAVVAEGIETVEQLAVLRDSGCVSGQGFLLGRPCDAEGATALLQAGRVELPSPPPSQGSGSASRMVRQVVSRRDTPRARGLR